MNLLDGAKRVVLLPSRFRLAMRREWPQLARILTWLFNSSETTNFTYELTAINLSHLADLLSVLTGSPRELVLGYLNEPLNDKALHAHIRDATLRSRSRHESDVRPGFGRRLGWYALARIRKPRVIVETGVDKGLGSVLLCSALAKNRQDGFPGYYYGTDINPNAGFLLCDPYSEFGRILYGDSITSLASLTVEIDLFINDSDHSEQYEYKEYQTIASKLSPSALILGDNSHRTDSLLRFAHETGRQFLFFSEQPAEHWYPGAGIGIAFFQALATRGLLDPSVPPSAVMSADDT